MRALVVQRTTNLRFPSIDDPVEKNYFCYCFLANTMHLKSYNSQQRACGRPLEYWSWPCSTLPTGSCPALQLLSPPFSSCTLSSD